MTEGELPRSLVDVVRDHEGWAVPIVFTLAFLESFAFVSLIVPATVVLFGVGGLIGAAAIGFWPSYLAAAAGAFVGDWLAYELARRYGGKIATMWPLSGDPTLLSRGFALSERWGVPFVFVGRFFGPLRASVPLVAGLVAMPRFAFQIANLASALVWAAGILAPGTIGLQWLLG
jgi:membrane protein DedA with SNARE-associated domain